jgi:hypothetical protein
MGLELISWLKSVLWTLTQFDTVIRPSKWLANLEDFLDGDGSHPQKLSAQAIRFELVKIFLFCFTFYFPKNGGGIRTATGPIANRSAA